MLHLILVLFVGIAAATDVTGEDGFEYCTDIFKPEDINMKCCDGIGSLANYEDCKQADECAQARCLLKKINITEEDGIINEESAKKSLDNFLKRAPKEKVMLERVKKYCLDGRHKDFAYGENCDAISFQTCSFINAIVVCPKWKQVEVCKKMESASKECRKVLDELYT